MPGLDNYAAPDNLLARIALHDYATDGGWFRWLFEHETDRGRGGARILDVGCGTGLLWTVNRDRIDPGWVLSLADASAGMTRAAREVLGERASYLTADVTDLPFTDDAFDIVVANHMLYHVQDRSRALREISRVLAPGGAFHCSTIGRGHMAELAALEPRSVRVTELIEEFGLETGPPQLRPLFTDIEVRRFDNSLRVPTAEPVLAYIRSSDRYETGTDLAAAQRTVEAEIARTGVFTISTRPGVISCRNGNRRR